MKKIAITHRTPITAADREAADPAVGVFWVLPGDTVVGDITPLSQAEDYNGILNGRHDHAVFWNTVKAAYRSNPDVTSKAYDYWPRGRVMQNSETGEYYILADQQIVHNVARLRKVCREFAIPFRKVVTNLDDHYRAKGDLGGELVAPENNEVVVQSFVDNEPHVKRNFPNAQSAINFLKQHYGAFSPDQESSLKNGEKTMVDQDEYIVMKQVA